jgi:hypothetical protein
MSVVRKPKLQACNLCQEVHNLYAESVSHLLDQMRKIPSDPQLRVSTNNEYFN